MLRSTCSKCPNKFRTDLEGERLLSLMKHALDTTGPDLPGVWVGISSSATADDRKHHLPVGGEDILKASVRQRRVVRRVAHQQPRLVGIRHQDESVALLQ